MRLTRTLLLCAGTLMVACAPPTPAGSADAAAQGAVPDAAGLGPSKPASPPQFVPSSAPTEREPAESLSRRPTTWGKLDCSAVRGLVQKDRLRPVRPGTSTGEIIQAAHDRGDITYERKLLYTVFSESDPGRLPRKYRGCDEERPRGLCANASVWSRIDASWDCLSPKVRDELECYRPRPTPKPTRCVHPDGIQRTLPRPRPNPCPAPKASAQAGYVRLVSRPPARICVDGADVGLTTPVERLALAAGEHTIELKNAPLKLSRILTVRIKANRTVAHTIRLR
jgi:hypothetical protein